MCTPRGELGLPAPHPAAGRAAGEERDLEETAARRSGDRRAATPRERGARAADFDYRLVLPARLATGAAPAGTVFGGAPAVGPAP